MIHRLVLIALCLSLAPSAWSAEIVASEPAARTIYLVRHGHYAPDPQADPRLGPGISPLGVAQARIAGARLAGLPLQFDALRVSPLQRARDTAAVIAKDFPGSHFEVVDDLAECTPPTRRADIMAREKADDLAACKAQFERLFASYFKPSKGAEQAELFVCHGNVIRYLATNALGVDPEAWLSMSIGHASITRVRIAADGSIQVTAIGDVGHLSTNLQTGASGDAERDLAIPVLP